jgi:c-di-GMP-binding flagellar brake protein YcgR
VRIRQDGRETEGRLADLSGSGAGVFFDGPDAPNLTVGQEADLVFDSSKFDTPLVLAARTQHRTEESGRRRYGFRFLEPQHLETVLPAEFRQYFNRRRSERVAPDPYRPVPVTLSATNAAETDARLVNISTSGAAISLEAPLEPVFADTTRITLTIHLPDAKRPLVVTADIRYRRLVGDRVYYGLEFDEAASDGFAKTQTAISRYAERLGERLRKSA